MKRVYEDIGKVVVAIVLFHLITISLKMVDDWAEASGDETIHVTTQVVITVIVFWFLFAVCPRVISNWCAKKFGKRKEGE